MLEGAKRRASMCWLTTVFSYSREVYRSSQQQFLNANFVWNHNETCGADFVRK